MCFDCPDDMTWPMWPAVKEWSCPGGLTWPTIKGSFSSPLRPCLQFSSPSSTQLILASCHKHLRCKSKFKYKHFIKFIYCWVAYIHSNLVIIWSLLPSSPLTSVSLNFHYCLKLILKQLHLIGLLMLITVSSKSRSALSLCRSSKSSKIFDWGREGGSIEAEF